MRLHRLEVEGFGPFRTRQVVDFDAFADDGIFLIAGRTGAGKSSILDAVCFGLYGGVPRYESGERRLRSDHCEPGDESRVAVEFSTAAGRFRVIRSPEYLRPAKRGGGMRKQAATAELERWAEGGWRGLAARAVDVAHELDGILQLNQQQFLQVILLAQNRFARFLLADSRERQALLRRLFGTERFEDVQARFDERRKASEQELGNRIAAEQALLAQAESVATAQGLWRDEDGADGGTAPAADEAGDVVARSAAERGRALQEAADRALRRSRRAAAAAAAAEKQAEEADGALAEARTLAQAQSERETALARLAELEADAPRIAAEQEALHRARAAEALREPLAAVSRARTRSDAAELALGTARTRWAAEGEEDIGPEGLDAWAEARLALIGGWERAAEYEAESASRLGMLAVAEELVVGAQERLAEIEQERARIPARREALEGERDAVRRRADRLPDLEQACRLAQARRDAAIEAERLRHDADAADRAVAEASAAYAAAQGALAELRRRRLDGFSGELAAALVDGQPCPVCGSAEHPVPAVHADPVSADDIDRAEAARDDAARTERERLDTAASVRAALAAATARAESRSPDGAEDEVRAAQRARDEAVAAGVTAREREADLAALGERAHTVEQERDAATRALAASREDLRVRTQSNAEAEAEIAKARGGFTSVAARRALAERQVSAARALSAAVADAAREEEALAAASARRDALLADSVFVDRTDAESALRTAAEQERLDARVTAHLVGREKTRARLAELEAQRIPPDPVDLDAVALRAEELRDRWKTAVAAASEASGTAERLAALTDAATKEHERGAVQTQAHETLRALADTIAGRGANTYRMTLETFVLAAELEDIVDAANRRLQSMSGGRYELQHSDALAARGAASGLGIVVFDAFTGQSRPAQSLSGGETFLASLALALGLSEVVTSRAGGIRLDTLFIDEGFGSLDGDTLEVALRTLDELRQGGRTVGVISHVEAMQEQIPAQLRVEQTESGPSRIVSGEPALQTA